MRASCFPRSTRRWSRWRTSSHVTLRGFIVEASLGNGIEVSGGSSNRIEACEVRNARQLGIRVTGGAGHRVEGCDIHDTGTGGLVLEGGDRKTLTPAGHEAVNNHIWRFSRHQLTSAYGIMLGGVGNRAAHNLMHDAPHMAIAIKATTTSSSTTSCATSVTETDDAGALYKGRNPSCRGNVIRYNFWRDIGSPMGHGTAAVYFDDGDGGDTVFGNVFFRCGHPGRGSFGTVFSHGGHDNRAENNIFIECQRALGSAPWDDQRWKDAVDGGQDCHWQRRLLKEVDITKPPYTTHYPESDRLHEPAAGPTARQPREEQCAGPLRAGQQRQLEVSRRRRSGRPTATPASWTPPKGISCSALTPRCSSACPASSPSPSTRSARSQALECGDS